MLFDHAMDPYIWMCRLNNCCALLLCIGPRSIRVGKLLPYRKKKPRTRAIYLARGAVITREVPFFLFIYFPVQALCLYCLYKGCFIVLVPRKILKRFSKVYGSIRRSAHQSNRERERRAWQLLKHSYTRNLSDAPFFSKKKRKENERLRRCITKEAKTLASIESS